MSLHDAPHDGEPEPGPATSGVRLAVGVEDVWEVALGDAGPGVLDRQLQLGAGVDEAHHDAAAPRREADGVGDEVDDHLHEPVLVTHAGEAVPHPLAVEPDTGLLRLRAHLVQRAGDDAVEVQPRAVQRQDARAQARHLEDLVHQAQEPVKELEKAWKDAIAEADRFVKANEFGEIVDREGGVGLNAFTSNDETGYFYSLPANRLELWAYLESERFLKPVMREFYKERDVVYEERRMRIESNPVGRLIEQFIATAFTAHPYGQSGVGWPSDLQAFSATDAQRFYDTYYVPSNMTVAVVGDVKTPEVVSLVERYFGRLPARPRPAPLRTVEPPQIA